MTDEEKLIAVEAVLDGKKLVKKLRLVGPFLTATQAWHLTRKGLPLPDSWEEYEEWE